ncbi:MAG: outer membrane protein assembly factor BamE [Pontibacterium sp.]
MYKIDVRQGNIITQDMVDQLRPGMTKNQVLFVLGTPLLADTFHKDRWDYVYSLQEGKGDYTRKQFTVFFKDGTLASTEGDYRPNTDKK